MAVPKKKRSRQMVAIRRTNSIFTLLKKYSILKKNSRSFLNDKSNFYDRIACDFYDKSCAYYRGSKSKKVCFDCYSIHFRRGFIQCIKK